MKEPLILTFDCGTQSIRALLVNKNGDIKAKAQKPFTPYYSLQPGWAEQKPEVYWDAICHSSNKIKADNPDLFEDVIAMTVTTIRDTCVCLDKDGNVLRDIIVWLDQRETTFLKPLPKISRAAFKLVGMLETANEQRRSTKSNWIQKNEPEIWAKTYKYMMFSGWMVYNFTGNFVDSVASQIGHIPFDYKSKKWKSPTDIQYPIFNIDINKMPELKQPGEILGYVTEKTARQTGLKVGLPVISTGSDKGCETIGCGVIHNDMAALSFGTTATVQFSTKKYCEPQPFAPSYPAVLQGHYNPEMEIFRGYWMVSWFKKEFAHKEVKEALERNIAPEELLNEHLNSVPLGCEGLMLQPYWYPTFHNPEARGSIIGFTDVHTSAHIYRAIIEGIGFALVDGLKAMETKIGNKINTVTVAGGGSQSDAICQITADMFGVPVKRIQSYEACGIGSSLVAFVAMKEFKDFDEAIESMVHYVNVFKPNVENHKKYMSLYNDVYKQVYKQLEPIYKAMKKIQYVSKEEK